MLAPAAGRQLQRWCRSCTAIQIVAAGIAAAAPLDRRQNDHQQQSSDSSRETSSENLGSSISPQVWVPAVVVVLVLLGVFCFIWTRTSVLSRLRGAASRAIRSSEPSSRSSNNNTREVTASQLTGGAVVGRRIGIGAGTTRNTNPRTGRRNRRTPSQMSTTSLPVYMKEPGDLELVIFRGPEEMDASNAIAEAREAEDREDDERDSASILRRESVLVLDEQHDHDHDPDQSAMSLDNTPTEPDMSTAELLPRGHQSLDSRDNDMSDTRSLLVQRRASDVPSEAPPGYDDFDETRQQQQRNSTTSTSTSTMMIDPPGLSDSGAAAAESDPPPTSLPPPPATATPESARNARRRSRLASRVSNFLHLRNGSSATHADAVAVVPEEPRVSDATTETSETRVVSSISLNDPPPSPSPLILSHPPVAQQHARHRHSQSGGSSSTLNLVLPFRTLSRQRSNNTLNGVGVGVGNSNASNANLTSPSALSLSLAAGAISAPLSHTLVRTEIRYPAGGPTPEQLRLLSAREGFGRFGVPYGADAVAHAATSRQELALDPPPEFESPTAEGGPSAAHGNGADDVNADNDVDGEDGEDGFDDPDALPADLTANDSTNDASSASASHARNRSTESTSASAVEPTTRILVPLFM